MNNLYDKFITLLNGISNYGNAIILEDYLVTAGHVILNENTYWGKNFSIQRKDALKIYSQTHEYNEQGVFYDFALFDSPLKGSPFQLAKELPKIGDKLTSVSVKWNVEGDTSFDTNIFSTPINETYDISICEATVIDICGNFIICIMSQPLGEGQSGSALIKGNKVYGILHGGENGIKCFYQSAISIREKL